ncbi:MAG: DUF499 domain-containing protein, partial [Nitrososphaeria archaeon]
EDIRKGRLEESVFAASLGDVVQNRGAVDYRDPEIFFRKTFFTTGLTNLISAVLMKLSGVGKGDTVIQIQTPFGGGKTHALLALYHVFKHPEEAMHHEAIKNILKKNRIARIPETKVVVFVGEYADPLKGRTLWGEIAHQLGCYELVKEYDEKRVAPDRNLISKILSKNKPVLILMDELLQYVVRTLGVEVKEGTLKGQVQSFLKALTEEVIASEKCALIATLPSSATQGFEEAEKAERILLELQDLFGRVEKIYTPVEGEELYEIIRKRLFEDLGDPEEHRKVVEEYFELYRSLGEDVPSECREAGYKERMLKAYPFHPETIDVLRERWATIPTFQRTRGALRLLAEVTADLFKRGHMAPLIQPAHINLGNPSIRREFIKHIGNEYEGVIASDISGLNAKAEKIDREIGKEYAGFNVATGIATSIFFYSFSGGERKGVTIQRLRLAFLRKDIPPTIVSEVVKKLEDELWFLHFEKNFYYFSNIVGLNRVIIDKEETIKEEDIQEEAKGRIERLAGKDFEVFVWPKSDSDVPDSKRLKLIILSYNLMADDPNTIEFMQRMINKYSTGFRTYKNTLVFAIADPNEFEGFKRSIRRFLALDTIKKDKETMMRLTEEDRQRVSQKLENADSTVSRMVLSIYRHIGKASKDGIKTFDLGIPTIEKGLTIARRVKEHLMDQDVLLNRISPKVLVEKTFSKEDDRKKISEIWEAFLKFPELPMLEGMHVLSNAVVQGVREGMFGLLVENKVKYAEEISPKEVLEEAFILRKEVAQKMREEAGIPVKEEIHPLMIPEKVSEVQKEVIKRIALRADVPWDKLSDIVRGVFTPLSREGAKIRLEVKIEAESHQGIKKDTLELKIRETLKQIGAKILEEKEE